jgi:hypothetical protein
MELFVMSEVIIPLTSSFLIKNGRVYDGFSVFKDFLEVSSDWQGLLRNTGRVYSGILNTVSENLKCN